MKTVIKNILRLLIFHASRVVWFHKPYARYIKPRDYEWEHPYDGADIVIECFGGCASYSFISYFRKWNPQARIAHHCHTIAPIKYAVINRLPLVVLTRRRREREDSVYQRTFHWMWVLRHLSHIYWRYEWMYCGSKVLVNFEEVIKTPALAVSRVNDLYGTRFNIGDNNLPNDTRVHEKE